MEELLFIITFRQIVCAVRTRLTQQRLNKCERIKAYCEQSSRIITAMNEQNVVSCKPHAAELSEYLIKAKLLTENLRCILYIAHMVFGSAFPGELLRITSCILIHN